MPWEQQLIREMLPPLRRLFRLLEEQIQGEQVLADVRRAIMQVAERLIELIEGLGASPELGPQPSSTLTANEAKLGYRKSKRKVWRIKGRLVRLTATLDALLRALTRSEPGQWKSAKELASQLGGKAEGANQHAVAQAIYRLREQLFRAGLDRRLVDSRRGHGYRWKAQRLAQALFSREGTEQFHLASSHAEKV